MATVIYINQNCIKILDGHQTQENYYVKDYKKIMMKYNENDLCLDLLDAYQKGINEYFEKIS